LQVLPGTESNLSATTFALEALRQVGSGMTFFAKLGCLSIAARTFPRKPFSRIAFNDGGFFFIANDPVRNKAGIAGKDATGRDRYASYGSATADGIRALRACGVSEEDPRLQAARRWLERSFRADAHPGGYANDREVNRRGALLLLRLLGSRALRSEGDDLSRRDRLAEALLGRQGADGSWVNSAVAVREDDPLVATSFAMLALAGCRDGNAGR